MIHVLDTDVRLGGAGGKFSHVHSEMNACARYQSGENF